MTPREQMTPKEQKLEDKFPRTNVWGTKVMDPSIHLCFTLAYFALIKFVFVLIKIVKLAWSDTNLVKTKSQIDVLLP